jgi:hypothetical protein
MKKVVACSLVALVAGLAVAAHATSGTLNVWEGTYLFRTQFQWEPTHCYYHLEMQDDGNLVTYGGAGSSNPRWWTRQTTDDGKDYNGALWPLRYLGPGRFAVLQSDSNFVVYDPDWFVRWASNHDLDNFPLPAQLIQQVDGNLVIYDSNNGAKWASGVVEPWFTGTCPSPKGKKTIVTGNTNRPGHDYAFHTLPIDSYPLCGDLCAHDENCRAWTYTPPGWNDPTHAGCWLKSSSPATSYLSGAISGEIKIDW